MNPYAFELAASPHLAAELGGHQIDRRLILEAYAALSAGHEGVIVEGAGGLLVPFGRYWTLADLLVDLHLPVIVVARAGLGTLNHTLLTLEALRARRLEVAGVVLNQLTSQAAGVIEADNVKVITDIGGAPVWGTMPHWERRDGELESVALCSRLVQMPELLSHVSPYLWPKVHTEM